MMARAPPLLAISAIFIGEAFGSCDWDRLTGKSCRLREEPKLASLAVTCFSCDPGAGAHFW
jgi:hypothetical protein